MINKFNSKFTLPEIYQNEITAATKEKLGSMLTDFSQASCIRGIIFGISNGISMAAISYMKSLNDLFIQNAEGAELDEMAMNLVGLTRLPATQSKVEVWVYGKTGSVSISTSQTFVTKEGNKFKPTTSASVSSPRIVVMQSVDTGDQSDCSVRGLVSCDVAAVNTGGVFFNLTPSFGGYPEETDEELRSRIMAGFVKSTTSQRDRVELMLRRKFDYVVRVDSQFWLHSAKVYVLAQNSSGSLVALSSQQKSDIAGYLFQILGLECIAITVESFTLLANDANGTDTLTVMVNQRVTNEVAYKVFIGVSNYLDPRNKAVSFSPAKCKLAIEDVAPEVEVVGVLNRGFSLGIGEVYNPSKLTVKGIESTQVANMNPASRSAKLNLTDLPRYYEDSIFTL